MFAKKMAAQHFVRFGRHERRYHRIQINHVFTAGSLAGGATGGMVLSQRFSGHHHPAGHNDMALLVVVGCFRGSLAVANGDQLILAQGW